MYVFWQLILNVKIHRKKVSISRPYFLARRIQLIPIHHVRFQKIILCASCKRLASSRPVTTMQPDYNIWRMASSLSVIFSYTPSYSLPVPRMYSTTSGGQMQLMLRATKLYILRELQIHVCNYTAEQVPA